MSSKRRLRRRQCEGKRSHSDKDAAWIAAKKTRSILLRTRPLHVYRCRFCGAFHVGHKPKQRRHQDD